VPSRPPIHRPLGWKPEAQRRAEQDKLRGSANDRGYDREWRNLRGAFLKMNPWCCEAGCSERATQVDHVLSVRARPDLRLAWDNLRSMCRGHHSSATNRFDGGFGNPVSDGKRGGG
jgi:5-methylcytosine-specific restriction enzyme A